MVVENIDKSSIKLNNHPHYFLQTQYCLVHTNCKLEIWLGLKIDVGFRDLHYLV